jgi:kynurenine formamidase
MLRPGRARKWVELRGEPAYMQLSAVSQPFAIIDVSHSIGAGTETYPGLPAPRIEALIDYEASRGRYAGQSEFFICSYQLCGNTGTYVDAPIHRHRGGADLAALPLEKLAHVPVVLIDASNAPLRGVGPEYFAGLDLTGKAVIVRSDWSQRFGTRDYFDPNPHLTEDACRLLVSHAPAIVGIDSVNIDDMADPRRPAHTLLLGAGIPICEHLTRLDLLTGRHEYFHAAPIAWRGGATFPVRAYVLRAA